MITLRCSSLDRIAACPASAVKPTVRIETQSEAAAMGSAVHEGLASRIQGADFDPGELAECWSRGLSDPLDREDVLKNVNIAHSLWSKVAAHFADPVTEHEFETAWWHDEDGDRAAQLTGHADVLSLSPDGREVLICDHKTGFADGDHEQQMRGYAYLALRENDGAEKATAVILRTRLGVIDTYSWAREELNQWADDLFRRVLAGREIYRPSVEACGYCPRAHECPARAAMIKTSLTVLDDVDTDEENGVPVLSPERLVRFYAAAKMVKTLAEDSLDLVRVAVMNAGGVVTLPDGRELRVKDVERAEIDVASGYETLEHWCGDLRSILKIGKGDAVELCRSLSRKGEKKKDREAGFLEALDQVGALKVNISKRLELVKAPKLVEVEPCHEQSRDATTAKPRPTIATGALYAQDRTAGGT